MSRRNDKQLNERIDEMLGEASWLISHAEALSAYDRTKEAPVEWGRAAACEEQVACLLEAARRHDEAAIHRVSAASCHERLGQFAQAVTLLRAALSTLSAGRFRTDAEQQLARCLELARKELANPILSGNG